MTIEDRDVQFQEAVETYRQGLYYEAHELWEDLWLEEDDDDRRRFLQALIQITSAIYKVQNDVARRGALSLLDRALQRLEGLPDGYWGIALDRFRTQTTRCREEVARLIEAGEDTLDPRLIPRLDEA